MYSPEPPFVEKIVDDEEDDDGMEIEAMDEMQSIASPDPERMDEDECGKEVGESP